MLPFVILAVVSGLRSLRADSMTRLWNDSWIDDDPNYERKLAILNFHVAAGGLLAVVLLPLFFDPRLADRVVRSWVDIPFLQVLPVGTILSAIVGTACAVMTTTWGAESILWSFSPRAIADVYEREEELRNIVDEMRLAAGIPAPHIYVIRERDPNAFAIGTSVGSSAIVVTTGLLAILTRDELQAVVAHEMSHIRNDDTQLMTTVTVLFGAVTLLSQWLRRAAIPGSFGGFRVPVVGFVLRVVFFVLWVVSLVFAPLIARIVAMAVSREREYLADASAAELTRNPKALARALVRIEKEADPTLSFPKAIAHLCVIDPLDRRINSKEGFFADLFATHPPMQKRLTVINAMAYE